MHTLANTGRTALAAALLAVVTGCGTAPVETRPVRQAAPVSPPGESAAPGPSPVLRYVFPVAGTASYARTHAGYQASDIMAPCGAVARSAVDGVVLEVSTVDRYDPAVNDGATRGGLSVSIQGQDGVRYYGSHLRAISAGIRPGVRVAAGQQVGEVGRTGLAGACHLHFAISPPCARTGDWWVRRGVVWPWPYLESWRAGGARSPAAEVASWLETHGCPAAPPPGA